MRTAILSLATTAALLVAAPLQAQMQVVDAWTRALPPVSTNGAAWLTLHNAGDETDRLLEVASPVARMVHLHETRFEDGVAQMGMVGELSVAPGEDVELAPGGLHLMLMGLQQPLVEGGSLPLTLRFENAGEITVEVPVLTPDATGPR